MKFIFIAIISLLFCCTKFESKEYSRAEYFREVFLKKFQKLDIPCSIEHQPHPEYKLVSFDPASLDTLILGGSGQGLNYYGVFSHSSFFTVIMYAPAAHSIPVIMTFDQAGNRISGTSIDFGCWDGGPYDYTCSGGFVINQDLSISLNHETVVTKSYDDRDSTEIFPWKEAHNWKGRILKSGAVEIDERPK